jgi:hypothetical protein
MLFTKGTGIGRVAFFHDNLVHNGLVLLVKGVTDVVYFIHDLVLKRGELLVQDILLGGVHEFGKR